MFLAHYITPRSTVILHSTDKHGALRSLVQRLHTENPSMSEEELLQRVLQREEKMTSHMGSGIA
ncbi:MAG: PTS sugar transporter subunit IIA, partial [Spirochaetia bacterium]